MKKFRLTRVWLNCNPGPQSCPGSWDSSCFVFLPCRVLLSSVRVFEPSKNEGENVKDTVSFQERDLEDAQATSADFP